MPPYGLDSVHCAACVVWRQAAPGAILPDGSFGSTLDHMACGRHVGGIGYRTKAHSTSASKDVGMHRCIDAPRAAPKALQKPCFGTLSWLPARPNSPFGQPNSPYINRSKQTCGCRYADRN